MAIPLTLAQAKQFLRYDADDQDDTISLMLRAGQEWVEDYTGIALSQRVFVQQVSALSGSLVLDRWPVTSVDSIDYVGTDGISGTVADSRLLQSVRPAVVYPAFGAAWPDLDSIGPHTVTYTAGYADVDDVPAGLLHAMLVYAGMSDEERGGDMSGTVWNAMFSLIGAKRRVAV